MFWDLHDTGSVAALGLQALLQELEELGQIQDQYWKEKEKQLDDY